MVFHRSKNARTQQLSGCWSIWQYADQVIRLGQEFMQLNLSEYFFETFHGFAQAAFDMIFQSDIIITFSPGRICSADC